MQANDNATETEGVDEPDDHGEPGTNIKRRNVDSSEEKGDDLKKCTDDEIVAIICHELGHWKMWHVTKRFVIRTYFLMAFALLIYTPFKYQTFEYLPTYSKITINV